MKLKCSFYTLPEQHFCNFLREWYIFSIPIKIENAIGGCISIISKGNCITQEFALIMQLLSYKVTNELIKSKNNTTLSSDIKLTKRQLEILKTLARGYTDRSVAMELGISLGTVRYHKTNIFRKFNAESCIQVIIKALKSELISLCDIEI